MIKITIEDIVFWIIILFIIGIILWLLSGSPTTESALISVGGALISSELLLWRRFYFLDKRTSINFMRIKHEMDNNFVSLRNNLEKNNIIINNRFDNMENKLNRLIRRK